MAKTAETGKWHQAFSMAPDTTKYIKYIVTKYFIEAELFILFHLFQKKIPFLCISPQGRIQDM